MYIIFKKPHKETFSMRICLPHVDIKKELEKVQQEIDTGAYITDKLPESRLFRNAWCKCPNKKAMLVDNEKAKDIHIDRVRKVRNKKLEELDLEVLRYIRDEEKLVEIDSKKQKLRDIPQELDLKDFDHKDPKKHWPKDLELHKEYQ